MLQPNSFNTELYHHGILGMKWGVRRYQNADGSLTSAGKKRYGKATDEGVTPKKNDPEPSTSQDEGGKLSAERKQEIIDRGDVKNAYRYISEFTNDDLRRVRERFDMEQSFKKLATPQNVKTGLDRLNKMGNYLQAAVKVTNNGIGLYNNMAKITNSVGVPGFGKTNLPIIASPNNKDKDKNSKK